MKTLRRVRDVIAWRQLGRWLYFYLNAAFAAASVSAFYLVILRPEPGELRVMGFFAIVFVVFFMARDAWRWWRYGS